MRRADRVPERAPDRKDTPSGDIGGRGDEEDESFVLMISNPAQYRPNR